MKHSEFEPLPLMQDMVFAKMFENNQSAGTLKGLINAVLRDAGLPPVSEIIEVKSEYTLLGDLIDQKKNDSRKAGRNSRFKGTFSHGGRVDVRARAADGKLISIEVQVEKDPFLNERSLFYAVA